MSRISPLAAVDPKAHVAEDVEIGPFCTVGPDVIIEAGTKLLNGASILGHTKVGRNNTLYPGAVLGGAPQDIKYKGAPTRLEIGDGNVFREASTVHRGTEKGGGCSKVGNNNYLMVNAHLGHDCDVGNNCILANNVMVGGHVAIGDGVNMAGGVGVNHFVTIGQYAFIGGYSRIHHDVPPFCKVDGADLVRGVNSIGLRRASFAEEDIESIERACRNLFYHEKPFAVAIAEFDTMNGLNPHVKYMIEFLRRRNMGRHGRYLESLRAK